MIAKIIFYFFVPEHKENIINDWFSVIEESEKKEFFSKFFYNWVLMTICIVASVLILSTFLLNFSIDNIFFYIKIYIQYIECLINKKDYCALPNGTIMVPTFVFFGSAILAGNVCMWYFLNKIMKLAQDKKNNLKNIELKNNLVISQKIERENREREQYRKQKIITSHEEKHLNEIRINHPEIDSLLDKWENEIQRYKEFRKINYRLHMERRFVVCASNRPGYLPMHLTESEYLRQWREICTAPYASIYEDLDYIMSQIIQTGYNTEKLRSSIKMIDQEWSGTCSDSYETMKYKLSKG